MELFRLSLLSLLVRQQQNFQENRLSRFLWIDHNMCPIGSGIHDPWHAFGGWHF
jgi:hypothetical protein